MIKQVCYDLTNRLNKVHQKKTLRNLPQKQNMGKGGKRKATRNDQHRPQPQPSKSNNGATSAPVYQQRTTDTGRPLVTCSACGKSIQFRKDCQQDTYCNKCGSRVHATNMCQAPTNTDKNDKICVHCGSRNHTSGNHRRRPNDNREEPKSVPRDSHNVGPHLTANIKKLGASQKCIRDPRSVRPANTEKLGKYMSAGHQGDHSPYKDYRYEQDRVGCQQTRFDKRNNRQYSANYNYYQPSPLVSIAGPDLSATLIDLANIKSRTLDLMVANQKSQQDVYNELARANKDEANEAMFAAIENI